jgi:uncharacterized membrane protein
MPKGKIPQRVHQQSVAMRTESFTGPLPPPALLEQYELLSPGFAERIIASWEAETAHRHDLEKKVVAAEIEAQAQVPKEIRRGQYLAFILAIAFLIAGVVLVFAGAGVAGTIISGSGFVGVIIAFLTTSVQARKGNNNGA